MRRFSNFTDNELDAMEAAFCNEGLKCLVDEIRRERRYRENENEEGMEEIDFIQPKKTVGKLISINEYKDKLDKIRKDISAIDINGQVDANTLFVRTGEQVKRMVLEIIDKYKAENEE